jgi:hypothetical protein
MEFVLSDPGVRLSELRIETRLNNAQGRVNAEEPEQDAEVAEKRV